MSKPTAIPLSPRAALPVLALNATQLNPLTSGTQGTPRSPHVTANAGSPNFKGPSDIVKQVDAKALFTAPLRELAQLSGPEDGGFYGKTPRPAIGPTHS